MSEASEPYPFESDDDIEIRELDLESVDAFDEARITVGDLAGVHESWRYGHVIVDEAQDLTAMQWRMVMRRVRGRSITIVGDLAQRSAAVQAAGEGSWSDLLPKDLVSLQRQDLTVNYRSPVEIHELAVAVLSEFAPDVAPSEAIRATGIAPSFRHVDDLFPAVSSAIDDVLAEFGGQVAVVSLDSDEIEAGVSRPGHDDDRVRFLTPRECKGLEFDAVVLVEPAEIWAAPGGRAQLYIALTRATQRLVVLHRHGLPPVLATG